MTKVLETASLIQRYHQREVCDDFNHGYDTTSFWKEVVSPASPVVGGVVSQAGTNNNDDIMLCTIDAPFVLAANKPIDMTARVSITNAAGTNAISWFVGVAEEAVSNFADFMVDDTGAFAAGYTMFGVYHVDGESNLRVVSGVNGTYVTSLTNLAVNVTTGAFTTIGVHVFPKSASQTEVAFTVDLAGGINAAQVISGDTHLIPTTIKHIVDITAELGTGVKPLVYAKQGSASVATMKTDLIAAAQHR